MGCFWRSWLISSCSRMPCNTGISEWEQPNVSSVVLNILQSPEWNQQNPSPSCQCSTDKKLTMMPICPVGAGGLSPRQRAEATGDIMLDLTDRNISDYLVKTYPSLIQTRQVGMSFTYMFKSSGQEGKNTNVWNNGENVPSFSYLLFMLSISQFEE